MKINMTLSFLLQILVDVISHLPESECITESDECSIERPEVRARGKTGCCDEWEQDVTLLVQGVVDTSVRQTHWWERYSFPGTQCM